MGQRTSAGLFVGLGARVSNTQLNMKTGYFEETGGPLDVAISGEGFFKVQTFDGIGNGEAYTRAGNFIVDGDGNLVLGTFDGPIVDGGLSFPAGYDQRSLTIQGDGTITVIVDGEPQEVGQMELHRFVNPHGLRQEGGNLFTKTEASGEPLSGMPGEAGYGTLVQGYLEASNVDPVRELVSMIRTQRNFELNSHAIKAADENMQAVNRLRR